MPSGSVTSAIASTGSNAPVEVVPEVAHTNSGTRPARRSSSIRVASASGSIASTPSVGTARTRALGMPATRASFSSEEWVSDVP